MSYTKQKPRCNFCLKELSRHKDVTLHIQNTPTCRQQWDITVSHQNTWCSEQVSSQSSTSDTLTPADHEYNIPEDVDYEFPHRSRYEPEDTEDYGPQTKRARVEEVADEEEPTRFAKVFPCPVADVLGVGQTVFEEIREAQLDMGLENNPWAPFDDEEEWGLAEWLSKRVNKTATDEFLKLAIVSLQNVSVTDKSNKPHT
jgi:hypothetical protein